MTQQDLASQVGVARQSVTKWENDYAMPKLEIIMRLAKIFNVSYEYLITGEEKKIIEETNDEIHEEPIEDKKPKKTFLKRKLVPYFVLSFLLIALVVSLPLFFVGAKPTKEYYENQEVGFYISLDENIAFNDIDEIKDKDNIIATYQTGFDFYANYKQLGRLDEAGQKYDEIRILDGHSSAYIYKIYFIDNKFVPYLYKELDLSDSLASYYMDEGLYKVMLIEYKEVEVIEVKALDLSGGIIKSDIIDASTGECLLNDYLVKDNNFIFCIPYKAIYFHVRAIYSDGSAYENDYYDQGTLIVNMKSSADPYIISLMFRGL